MNEEGREEDVQATFLAAQERSRETKEKIEKSPSSFKMITGDRPTGRLHLGHFFGSIKSRVELQNKGLKCAIVIADYQVITDRDTTAHIEDNVIEMVIDYMACGIDPEKTIIFTHSYIPEINQLMLPFMSLVSEAELLRNPTVHAEMLASNHSLTALLLTYPVHQSCDILFYSADGMPTVVPVGKDNLPHIQIARTIAKRFNSRFGTEPTFSSPIALLSDAPEIPGLDGRKMSKSYKNSIMLCSTEEETRELIKKSPSDSERKITFDPEKRPQISALLTTAALTTGRSEKEIAEDIGNGGAGALKSYVTESVNEFLAPVRERRRKLEQNKDKVREILRAGNEKAEKIAASTLQKVREAMNMIYY